MASKITAIRTYRPEIDCQPTLPMDKLVDQIADRTGLNKGEILYVTCELHDAIVQAHLAGRAVRVEGLGTFTPTIRADGRVDSIFRSEPALRRDLNDRNLYAKIRNKASIGKSSADLVARWNREHPDDPVV